MSDIDMIKNAPGKAAKIVAAYRRAASVTNGKTLLSEREKRAHIEKLQSDAQMKLDALDDEVAKAYQQVTARTQKTIVASASEDQLTEMKKGKAWDRLRGMLDASLKPGAESDTLQLIQDAVKSAVANKDAVTMQMLQEEVQPYLVSKDMSYYADILPTVFKPGNELLGKSGPATVANEVSPGYTRVQTALEMSRHAVTSSLNATKGSIPITLAYDIPSYESNETIAIEAEKLTTEEKDAQGRKVATQNLPDLVEVA